MNLEKLKEILINSKIFVKVKNKNIIAICPFCGDHPNPRKKGHLYISTNPQIPVCHCWLCNHSIPIQKLISDLTGNKNLYREVITEEELKSSQKNQKKISSKKRFDEYKIPEIISSEFENKRLYVQGRSNNLIEIDKIPGLVFDFQKFVKLNNLDIVGKDKILSEQEFDLMQRNFVGFLGKHNTYLFCRNVDPTSSFKFKKIQLQPDSLPLLEYWSIESKDITKDLIVLTEGIFNSIGEYVTNSLGLKDKVRSFVSGNTFSYSTLLKSVCYDLSLYKANVIILSDNDKKKKDYHWFLKENSHIIKSCKIYINKNGKDFGIFPQVPVELL